MSEMDKVLGDLLGGKGGTDLGSILGGLTGGGGASSGLSGGGSMLTKLLPILGGLLAGGGLQKILVGLQQQGLGAQASSWVGTGANEPVTGGQVAKVLGDQGIAQIAQQLGVSNEEAAGIRFGSAASVGALGEWCGRVACGNLKPALVATRGAPAWLGRAGRTRTDPKQPPLRTPGNRPAHERRRT